MLRTSSHWRWCPVNQSLREQVDLLARLFLPGNMQGEPLAGSKCEYFEGSPSFAVILSHSRQCKFEVLVIHDFSAIRLPGRATGDEFSMLQHTLGRLNIGLLLSDCLGDSDMAHLFGWSWIRARNTGLISQCVLNPACLEGSEPHDKVSTVVLFQGCSRGHIRKLSRQVL